MKSELIDCNKDSVSWGSRTLQFVIFLFKILNAGTEQLIKASLLIYSQEAGIKFLID